MNIISWASFRALNASGSKLKFHELWYKFSFQNIIIASVIEMRQNDVGTGSFSS